VSDRPYIAVVGSGEAGPELASVAEEVGKLLARSGAVVVCGGLGGVMEATCKGAKQERGTTVAILPSLDRASANPYVDVAVATGMDEMRNALVVRSADALIALDGEFGTLSEIAFALKTGVPVVGIGTWELAKGGAPIDAIATASTPEEAVELAFQLAGAAP
jgi:uncharacterized protein (TIGR00725 family)